jgi:Tripartite ATP-independent periplasmic transporters, DctQ component
VSDAAASPGRLAALGRLEAAWTRLELALSLGTAAALVVSLLAWVALKGLSARTTDTFVAGVVFRGLMLGTASGALAARLTGRAALGWGAALVGALAAWPLRQVGVEYFGNLLAWLQDGSLLTWFGGLRGLGTRLTMLLALLGASLATASGRHVTIDVVTRALPEAFRPVLLRLSGAVALAVCAAASWGFFDFSAVDAFEAPPASAPLEKAARVGAGLERHLSRAARQLRLDLTVLPRVLAGQPWGQSLSGEEWNRALEGDPSLAAQREPDPRALRVPLLSTPDETSRGIFVKDLGLMVPFGLLMMALRFGLWLVTGAVVASPHGGAEERR